MIPAKILLTISLLLSASRIQNLQTSGKYKRFCEDKAQREDIFMLLTTNDELPPHSNH
jgi:hypothetical protein